LLLLYGTIGSDGFVARDCRGLENCMAVQVRLLPQTTRVFVFGYPERRSLAER
jgi:hypothetical protein